MNLTMYFFMRYFTYLLSGVLILNTFALGEDKDFLKKDTNTGTKTGPLFNVLPNTLPPTPTETHREAKQRKDSENKANAALSMTSVLIANSTNIWETLSSIGSEKKGRYDRMSISGKDYIDLSYNHSVSEYNNYAKSKMFIHPRFVSFVDTIGDVEFPNKYYTNGIDLWMMNNLTPYWDAGFGIGIDFISFDDTKVPFTKDASSALLVSETSGIGLSLGTSLQYNKQFYGEDKFRGNFFTRVKAAIFYTRRNIEETVYNLSSAVSVPFSVDEGGNDFDFGLGLSIGSEFWFDSVCIVPEVGINKDFDPNFGISIHKTLGFYDTFYIDYSFGDHDLGDWQSFRIGFNITNL
mgnify:FL=1